MYLRADREQKNSIAKAKEVYGKIHISQTFKLQTMSSIDQISKYIYQDDEQQRAEFVQQYRAKSVLKRTMLKELLYYPIFRTHKSQSCYTIIRFEIPTDKSPATIDLDLLESFSTTPESNR